ncbi:hypothetical protein [Tenacibaculum sp. M341]|uniref:hypothetical protein n=1 Tax=Tenacibaculum sp. M341 TaxID=2530339 RepID=UPI0010434C70|nr:hypothetical protein [Tenacibaculum sp. M341]TCI93036.1 hypothetical protein EYW44_05295 [Tenacibaculum sp. M341]
MLRPITPFVEYAINYDYISKILCINKDKPALQCNGKCQLMKKLKQQQEDDYSSLRIVMEEYPIGFVEVLDVQNNTTTYKKQKNNYHYSVDYSYLYLNAVFHPPTV